MGSGKNSRHDYCYQDVEPKSVSKSSSRNNSATKFRARTMGVTDNARHTDTHLPDSSGDDIDKVRKRIDSPTTRQKVCIARALPSSAAEKLEDIVLAHKTRRLGDGLRGSERG